MARVSSNERKCGEQRSQIPADQWIQMRSVAADRDRFTSAVVDRTDVADIDVFVNSRLAAVAPRSVGASRIPHGAQRRWDAGDDLRRGRQAGGGLA